MIWPDGGHRHAGSLGMLGNIRQGLLDDAVNVGFNLWR
jgi:hypothetical protein